MAIFAFGVLHDNASMAADFFRDSIVGITCDEKDNITGHTMIKSIKTGDIVYLKHGNTTSPIVIEGIGIIENNEILKNEPIIKIGRKVKWLYKGEFEIAHHKDGQSNTRLNFVFEEFNPDVQLKIIEKLPVVVANKS